MDPDKFNVGDLVKVKELSAAPYMVILDTNYYPMYVKCGWFDAKSSFCTYNFPPKVLVSLMPEQYIQ